MDGFCAFENAFDAAVRRLDAHPLAIGELLVPGRRRVDEDSAQVGIALGRFTVEFFREPDSQLADFARQTGLSMGQWLTVPLIVLGIALAVRALMRPPLGAEAQRPVAASQPPA